MNTPQTSATAPNGERPHLITGLEYAIQILKEPRAWTQQALARDHRNEIVPVESPRAVSHCIVGAICRATSMMSKTIPQETITSLTQKLLDEVDRTRREESQDISIVAWNNDPFRTHRDIQRVLSRTVERMKEGK